MNRIGMIAQSAGGLFARHRPDLVDEYERQFAGLFDPPAHAVSFFKGRVGLFALLRAIGLSPGDEVLVPGFTCFVVPAAAVFAGGTPRYMDVDPVTGNPIAAQVREQLSPRTKAVVVHHMLGNPCAELPEIVGIARERNIAVIEDCAHVLAGTRIDGVPLGTQGTASFFSMQWSKPYSTGLGGMVLTRDADLAARLRAVQAAMPSPGWRTTRMLLLQGMVFHAVYGTKVFAGFRDMFRRLSRAGLVVGSSTGAEWSAGKPARYEQRLSPAQAAQGIRRLRDLDANRRRRLERLVRASEFLNRRAEFEPVPLHPQAVPLSVPVRSPRKLEYLAAADAAGVELGDWFRTPLHPLAMADCERLGYRPGECPRAERLCGEMMNLPLHASVAEDYLDRLTRVCEKVGR